MWYTLFLVAVTVCSNKSIHLLSLDKYHKKMTDRVMTGVSEMAYDTVYKASVEAFELLATEVEIALRASLEKVKYLLSVEHTNRNGHVEGTEDIMKHAVKSRILCEVLSIELNSVSHSLLTQTSSSPVKSSRKLSRSRCDRRNSI